MKYTFGRDEARQLPNWPMKPWQQQTGIKSKTGEQTGEQIHFIISET